VFPLTADRLLRIPSTDVDLAMHCPRPGANHQEGSYLEAGRREPVATDCESSLPRVTGIKVVYIAGSSYSGSTLLGLLLGSQTDAVFAGELKQFWRPPNPRARVHQLCTCGLSYDACGFWKHIRDLNRSSTDPNPIPGLYWRNLLFFVRLLAPMPFRRSTPNAYGALVKTIHQTAAADGSTVQYVVDSSKSIWALDRLVQSKDVETHVIHLVRDGAAVLDSLKRRGFGRWRGMVSWSAVNLVLRLYVRRRRLPQLRLDYGALCLDTAAQCRRMNAFLGINLSPEHLVDDVRSTAYHIFRGGMKARDSAAEFAGIRYRRPAPASSWTDRLLSTLIAAPINRLLGIVPPAYVEREPSA